MHYVGSIILLMGLLAGASNSNAAKKIGDELRFFTDADMQLLARKSSIVLRKCKQLRNSPDVIVEIENTTDSFIDKTQFAAIIHGLIEGKTHTKPESKFPQYEIRGKLDATKKTLGDTVRLTYTLTTKVIQAEEVLCLKKAKLVKLSRR